MNDRYDLVDSIKTVLNRFKRYDNVIREFLNKSLNTVDSGKDTLLYKPD